MIPQIDPNCLEFFQSLHPVEELNPHINLTSSRLEIPVEVRELKSDQAGMILFGPESFSDLLWARAPLVFAAWNRSAMKLVAIRSTFSWWVSRPPQWAFPLSALVAPTPTRVEAWEAHQCENKWIVKFDDDDIGSHGPKVW